MSSTVTPQIEYVYLNALNITFPYKRSVLKKLLRGSSISEAFLEYVWKGMSQNELREYGLTIEDIELLQKSRTDIDPHEQYALIKGKNIRLITQNEPEYPRDLINIADKPYFLYVQGDISMLTSQKTHIAVVGSRKCTQYGRAVTAKLIKELTPLDPVIVSGLAYGIDSHAHKTALTQNMSTIAVLGSGHKVLEKKSHHQMVREILDNHVVISEYPYAANGTKYTFPARNRIISGLSKACVVIEAGARSGALITARFALNQGKDIFAVPNSIFSKFSEGCHELIQKGEAEIFTNTSTFLESIKLSLQKLPLTLTHDSLPEIQKDILGLISNPIELNDLIEKLTHYETAEILTNITDLELQGRLQRIGQKIVDTSS